MVVMSALDIYLSDRSPEKSGASCHAANEGLPRNELPWEMP